LINADTFVLYRILGNDLYPRHKKGQTRENLQFALETEPQFEKCEKRWIVNRIIDKEAEHAVIELLLRHNQQFIADRRITYFRMPQNMGICHVLNKALELVDTKYMIQVDSDD